MKTKQQPRMSIEEFTNMQKAMKPAKASKYHAQPTTIDGIRFMSKSEAARYCELKMLERGGEIIDLRLQPKYDLCCKCGEKQGRYIADFFYFDNSTKKITVEDVKGAFTAVYKRKKKHFEKQYGMKITETTMNTKRIRDAFALYGVKI